MVNEVADFPAIQCSEPSVARASIVRAIEASGVVAIIRMSDAAHLSQVVDALTKGGVQALESR